MTHAVDCPLVVPFDGSFRIADRPTEPPDDAPGRKESKRLLGECIDELRDLQRVLFADNRYAVLLIFQAMDAAGKDGTIRAVMSGVNPAGCQVFPFQQPTPHELDHDFLWRTARVLPERGRIGIFNRSYYEEVLVVRVHPGLLGYQRLPRLDDSGLDDKAYLHELWQQRLESIGDHEKHLARNGTVVLKFWLNVSRDEQRRRFLARIDKPEKNWKFSASDVREREHWYDYMVAYEEALRETSRSWAPWYAIPADRKPWMRLKVAEILVQTLRGLDLSYPEPDPEDRRELHAMRRVLEAEGEGN